MLSNDGAVVGGWQNEYKCDNPAQEFLVPSDCSGCQGDGDWILSFKDLTSQFTSYEY